MDCSTDLGVFHLSSLVRRPGVKEFHRTSDTLEGPDGEIRAQDAKRINYDAGDANGESEL